MNKLHYESEGEFYCLLHKLEHHARLIFACRRLDQTLSVSSEVPQQPGLRFHPMVLLAVPEYLIFTLTAPYILEIT